MGFKDGVMAQTKRYRCYWCGTRVYMRDERMPPSGRHGYLCWVNEPGAAHGRVRALLCRVCHESIGPGAEAEENTSAQQDEDALEGMEAYDFAPWPAQDEALDGIAVTLRHLNPIV